jgi:hypothetical protein
VAEADGFVGASASVTVGATVSFVQENAKGVAWIFPALSLPFTQRVFDPSVPIADVILVATGRNVAGKTAPSQFEAPLPDSMRKLKSLAAVVFPSEGRKQAYGFLRGFTE